MARYENYNQEQSFFVPIDMDVNFPEGSYVRFLNDFIDQHVSIKPFEDKRKNDNFGELAKHPKMMLKVIFYAFSQGIYSLRKISSEYLIKHIDFIYLAGYETAHYSTFSRFINLYMEEITDIFVKVLYFARGMGFVNGHLIAIDGCKIKANASKSFSGNFDKFKKKKILYEKMIKNLLERSTRLDKKEKSSSKAINIEKEKKNISRLEKKYNNILMKIDKALRIYEKDEQKQKEKKQVNLTDPDSAIMKKGYNIFQGYNCQAMVDNDGMIIANDIVNNCSDRDQAIPMVHVTAEMLREIGMSDEKIKSISFLMDKGYNDSSAIGLLMDQNYNIYIPFYNQETDLEKTNLIKSNHCKLSVKKGICKLECPGGQMLTGTLVNKSGRNPFYRFAAKKVCCLDCKFAEKCFNKTKKEKYFSINSSIIDNYDKIEKLKEKMSDNDELDIYHKRLGTVEPAFGTMTYHRNFKGFLVRGMEKVKLQWNMVCTAFNLRRLWKLLMQT